MEAPRSDAGHHRPPPTRYELDRQEAYAIASVAGDLRIHEVVDAPNWVVGAFIPETLHGRSRDEAPQNPGLRRELRFWEAIALSIGIMAPTAAMALNGTGVAATSGGRSRWRFIFATIGVLLVSYAFIRLSRYFSHAGSVYAFSGVTLGPRAGFFSGWALLGTYLAFTCASPPRSASSSARSSTAPASGTAPTGS